ncbi:hypothetical protein Nepgr_007502 [Nepenthes gracilis]|uniref:SAND domain-containing protein n=1 Tax=Nepenthes gracilis TaxID=150966 RepID=A0AAD3S706_NEPGR|nr:hypothetical protein Nepgr_007502 [Nepenthes gracilis]
MRKAYSEGGVRPAAWGTTLWKEIEDRGKERRPAAGGLTRTMSKPIASGESCVYAAADARRELVPADRNNEVVPHFTKKELGRIDVLRQESEFIEVVCGITSSKHGDFLGKLRIYARGKLEITCECQTGCPEGNLKPSEFGKHAGYRGTRKWQRKIWVTVKGKKVSLGKTKLLKYYKGSASDPSAGLRPLRGRVVHHDEFIQCTICNKERRFLLRTHPECRIFHDASFNKNWTCADFPYAVLRCKDAEERACKRKLRGCPRKPTCRGCSYCVCFGCPMCRFQDCSCRICVDFILNAEPSA